MKTKIRGLVFVGFAAAIFAASAHAEQTDAQTVTSKQFTEATYEKKAPAFTTDNETGLVNEDAAWVGWHEGQNDENTQWVKLTGEGYPEIKNVSGKGHIVRIKEDKIARYGADGQGHLNQIVANSDSLATANAVYEYVQDTIGDLDEYQPKTDSTTPQVGIKVGNNATWYNVGEGQDGQQLSTAHKYVQVNTDNGSQPGHTAGVYFDLRHDLIIGVDDQYGTGYATGGITANSGNNLTTGVAVYNYVEGHIKTTSEETIGSQTGQVNDTDVPTMKNVYDFVTNQIANGDFQPKAAALAVDNNQIEGAAWIGWSENQTGTQPAGDVNAKWVKLIGDTYTEIYHDKDSHRVRLVGDKIANAGTDLTLPENQTDLVTVAALNNATGSAGPIPSACKQANVHCAIVSSYDTTTQTATAEWTVMAQAQ